MVAATNSVLKAQEHRVFSLEKKISTDGSYDGNSKAAQ